MDELKDVLEKMRKADKRWNADDVDDPEDMFDEYPDFLKWAIPILEKCIEKYDNYSKKTS